MGRIGSILTIAGLALVGLLATGCSAIGLPRSPDAQSVAPPSVTPSGARSSAPASPSPTTLPTGAHIVFTAPLPTNGTVGVGGGAVWVVDRQGGDAADPNRAALLRIAPDSGRITDRIRGVIGSSIAATDDGIWVASARTDRLIRVSPDGEQMTSIRTAPNGTSDDIYPYAVVATADAIWVANHHAGTIARIDPRTNAVVASVQWGEAGGGGPTHLAIDGSSVWVTSVRTMDLVEIDTATNRIVDRVDLAPAGACGGLAAGPDSVWAASGFDRPFSCWQPEHWGVSRVDRATRAVTRIDVGARPADVRIGFGSVWVLTDEPTTELLRLDPITNEVVGRLALPLRPDLANPLAIGLDAIWVRLVREGSADGALLKIQPGA
jgi:hypothetical protein